MTEEVFAGIDLHSNNVLIGIVDESGRTVDVIPTPGHSETQVAFYDSRTGILFSGDFLLPGRLLIEDAAAYHESALRILDFLKTRPLTHGRANRVEGRRTGLPFRISLPSQ